MVGELPVGASCLCWIQRHDVPNAPPAPRSPPRLRPIPSPFLTSLCTTFLSRANPSTCIASYADDLAVISQAPTSQAAAAVTQTYMGQLELRLATNRIEMDSGKCILIFVTNQYSRSFIPAFVDKWNSLGNSVFDGVGVGSFKTLVNRSLFGWPFYFPFLSGMAVWGSADLIEPCSFLHCHAGIFNNNNNNHSHLYATQPRVILNGIQVMGPVENTLHVLGVTLYRGMTFRPHVQEVSVRARSRLGELRAVTSTTFGNSKESVTALYKQYVRPIMEYACPVWTPGLALTHHNTFQKTQNAALRFATGCTRSTPVQHLHNECKVLPLRLHMDMRDAHVHVMGSASG